MLFPKTTRCRTVIDLSGCWQLRPDPESSGEKEGWCRGFDSASPVGVPGSWNEQLAELGLMNYSGAVWYQHAFALPDAISDKKIILRFGSVDFHAKVWLNGKLVGEHSGGYLPFEIEVTSQVSFRAKNLLVLRVDNTLSHETIPQGVSRADYLTFSKERDETFPTTAFDFFVYGGIHRPVQVIALSDKHLCSVRVDTQIEKAAGRMHVSANFTAAAKKCRATVSLLDDKEELARKECEVNADVSVEFVIDECQFWSLENPHLYNVKFELFDGETLVDEYELETGVREIKVTGDKLLLNGKEVFLKGFGKHEDFAVLGKGLSHALLVKDFQLMRWIGANSFRTSHYPYAEEVMNLADKLGFLVIDEVPAVSLNFKYVNDKTLANHKQSLSDLVARDRNHPCVISWSVANEPGIWMEPEAVSPKAEKYWQEICSHVRSLDTSRPITLPAFSKWGDKDLAFKFSDFLSINRYWGWYERPGDLEAAGEMLREELQKLHEKYKKPILISEFGADTIEGEHATYPQMFTEEYQTHFIEKYFEVIESLPFTVGEHIWNMADFRTAQHHRRVILNKKGVFTRDRLPKSAAFAVRKHWLNG